MNTNHFKLLMVSFALFMSLSLQAKIADSLYSVQLIDSSFSLSGSILHLGDGKNLQLTFDLLGDQAPTFFCKIVHCDAQFKPSNLMTMEYFEGGNSIPITHYSHSINTIQPYYHYWASVPGEYGKLTKSGNYQLQLFLDTDPGHPVLAIPFQVVENLINATAVIKPSTVIEERSFKQQLDFILDCNSFPIENPYDNILVQIHQNQRIDNAKLNVRPTLINDKRIEFNGDNGSTVFTGGNEFRSINLKSLFATSEKVQRIYKDSLGWEVNIAPEEKRSFKRHAPIKDLNGRFLLYDQDATAGNQMSGTEGDYLHVHFFIPNLSFDTDGDYYLIGGLVNWDLGPNSRFSYNLKRNGYELNLLLKQGFFDYQVVYLPKGLSTADETVIEGMHAETENEYTIIVFYKDPVLNYDRLILVYHLNSQK